MKDGLTDTPSQGDWLCKVLPTEGRVGVDPYLMAASAWKPLCKQLASNGMALVPVEQNLIDIVWAENGNKPSTPANPVIHLDLKYTGKSWQEKVKEVRQKMKEKKAPALVLTALDDIAWFFNLRGSDIAFNPCFFSYAAVTNEAVLLFIDDNKLTTDVNIHLGLKPNASLDENVTVTIQPYGAIKEWLTNAVETCEEGKIWLSDKANYALFNTVPERKCLNKPSPVAEMKSVKNEVEIAGMKNAHVKDAVALCEYIWWLEKEVPNGQLTEISASDYLETLRQKQEDFVSLSFETISGSGPNGAIIHYRAQPETNKPITTDQMYLVDSGAQFKDGTTDVTRTVHMGTPSNFEKECYTRVLKGHINLATCVFPNGVKGMMLDTLARVALWDAGLDYLHGTGHGVGSFLNVHEGPCGIGFRYRADEIPLKEGMILSDEPGYYEDGQFGIRIENLVVIIKANPANNFKGKGFLTMEPITLVPIQTKMIMPELLSEKEITWLNDYHLKCRDVVGKAMLDQGKKELYQWLLRETEPLG